MQLRLKMEFIFSENTSRLLYAKHQRNTYISLYNPLGKRPELARFPLRARRTNENASARMASLPSSQRNLSTLIRYTYRANACAQFLIYTQMLVQEPDTLRHPFGVQRIKLRCELGTPCQSVKAVLK